MQMGQFSKFFQIWVTIGSNLNKFGKIRWFCSKFLQKLEYEWVTFSWKISFCTGLLSNSAAAHPNKTQLEYSGGKQDGEGFCYLRWCICKDVMSWTAIKIVVVRSPGTTKISSGQPQMMLKLSGGQPKVHIGSHCFEAYSALFVKMRWFSPSTIKVQVVLKQYNNLITIYPMI